MISAIVVTYRSGDLAVRALASLEEDAAAAGIPLETVAVVNSGDAKEAARVRPHAHVTIEPGENLGYAGGLNRGIAAARGDVFFLMNPDITVRPGTVAALEAVVRDAPLTMAGPATFLDEEESILIPVFDEPTPLDLVRRRLLLDPRGAERVFARRLPRVLRTVERISRRETFTVTALSGGMMAVSRRALERVGPFDERYRLYFEENDWQRRCRACGGRLLLVGRARAVHPYGRSTAREPQAGKWFAESERRFFTEHFPRRGPAALDALGSSASHLKPWPRLPVGDSLSWEGEAAGVALSPLRTFSVFGWAGVPAGARTFRPPASFRKLQEGAAWYARAVEKGTGRVLSDVALGSS